MSITYDVVISFDTTGSMSQCIREVKRNIEKMVVRLFSEIPNIRIGIVAHGDYCDENETYLMKRIDLGNDSSKITDFVKNVQDTFGGDTPEAYEYVLREVQNMNWQSDSMRALVMIGDAYPHEKDSNPYQIDWRHEVEEINKMGVNIYSIQALNCGNAKSYTFYKQMASMTNGYHLMLDQFRYISDILVGICFHRLGTEQLEKYEQELEKKEYGMTKGMRKMFDALLNRSQDKGKEDRGHEGEDGGDEDGGREDGEHSERHITHRTKEKTKKVKDDIDASKLIACAPAKYQVLHVDSDISIKSFVESNGLQFKKGKGFYEFTKTETIQSGKELVLMHKSSGELFEGDSVKTMLGLGSGSKFKPTTLKDYRLFVQSTSYNRKLVGGTEFLYEAEDFGRE
jgi:hypothetical protein